MRRIFFGLLIVLFSGLASAQQSIRQVDFKNFTYPLSGPLLGHGELKWLRTPEDEYSNRKPINLVHGQDGEGFTLQSVTFSDVTGDGQEDAIAVLLYQTGGTQNTHYVYIYSFTDGKPKLLAYCHTGSRGYSGLYGVYGARGALVFELLDQKKMEGECCSSGFVRTRYRWRAGRFEAVGAKEYGEIKEP
ncbi:MAG TPA: hypothetical protein VMQ56_17535 [Terracidiphilus sp.]|jgi:hypothetical protein|nr:hypothetical protein [Terracidiphilus sp.]